VIEAINLFLAGQYPNSIFLVAMEPEMVAAHVEAAYGNLVEKIEEQSADRGQPVDLGWKFLEKFVQLPLTLPDMEQARRQGFFESLFHAETPASAATEAPAEEAEVQAAKRRLETSQSLEEAVELAGEVAAEAKGNSGAAAEREAVRQIVEERLSRDNPEVQRVISYAARFLDPNPREIKRFVNVFRFFVMIQTERKLAGLPTPGGLIDLAKLAVVNVRWPSLMAMLAQPAGTADGKTVFELLEDPPAGESRRGESKGAAELRRLRRSLARSGLSTSAKDRLLSGEIREFMKTKPTVGSAAGIYL
jgi:hypothetical protein